MYDVKFSPDKKTLSDKELIEVLRNEIREVRIQRNKYQQELIKATQIMNYLRVENKNLTAYIDRKKQM